MDHKIKENTPDLQTLQSWFQQVIKHPEEPETSLKKIKSTLTKNVICTHCEDPPEKRLRVYRLDYYARMIEALEETFEALSKVLGEDTFFDLGQAYVRKYPSQTPNLTNMGIHMPRFLKDHPVTQDFPFLPDLATFECNFSVIFHAFNHSKLTQDDLKDFTESDMEQLKLQFQPTVKLIASEWPVLDIWKARNQEQPPNDILQKRPQQVLLCRPENDVYCEILNEQQFIVLEALVQGKTLGESCSRLERVSTQERLPQISEWFSNWLGLGIFEKV